VFTENKNKNKASIKSKYPSPRSEITKKKGNDWQVISIHILPFK